MPHKYKKGRSSNLHLTRGEDIYHFIKPYSSFIQLLIIGAISAWFSTRFELTTLLSPTPHNYSPHSQLFPICHESLL